MTSLDIDWGQVQQILTFLIIFIAPAILSRFNKKDQEEQNEPEPAAEKRTRLDQLLDHKPIVLKELQLPTTRSPETRKEVQLAKPTTGKTKGIESKHDSKVTPAPVAQKPKPTQIKAARVTSAPLEVNRESHKPMFILGVSAKKAFLLKEVLGAPRGSNPF